VVAAGLGYRRVRTEAGAILALAGATLAQAVVMVAINSLLLPFYLGLSGPGLTHVLLAAILPFNLLKGAANSSLVYVLYKRISGYFPRSR
jgi:riboflavin transporter FmnP